MKRAFLALTVLEVSVAPASFEILEIKPRAVQVQDMPIPSAFRLSKFRL
jgi:hypothetical protein